MKRPLNLNRFMSIRVLMVLAGLSLVVPACDFTPFHFSGVGADGDGGPPGGDGDAADGGDGDDTLYGRGGDDLITGGRGDDVIYNGVGDDTVVADNGKDTLWGGAGNDVLTGGGGDDVFIFEAGSGSDTITDFTLADDTLNLVGTTTDFTDLASVTAASSNTTVDGTAGLMIDLGGGGSVFLEGLSTSDLSGIDFVLDL